MSGSDFVIGGWLPGIGVTRHTVGALLVGAYTTEGRLRACGVDTDWFLPTAGVRLIETGVSRHREL